MSDDPKKEEGKEDGKDAPAEAGEPSEQKGDSKPELAPEATRRPPVERTKSEPEKAERKEAEKAEDEIPPPRSQAALRTDPSVEDKPMSRVPSTLGSVAPSAPERGILPFLRERLALTRLAEDWLERPIVGGPNVLRALFGAWLALVCVLFATGIGLAMVYSPSVQTAWASVRYIQNVVPGGAFLRGLHRSSSDALIVITVLLPIAKAMRHAHRRPYEVAWWLGLAALPLVLGLAVTGHALPWDQFGWWARRVEINITQMAPGGDGIAKALLGGHEIGAVALSRFHTLHVLVLPALLILAVLAEHGVTKRLETREAHAGGVAEAYFPRQALWDLLAGFAALGVVAWLAGRAPAPLDAPADPMRDYPARPEWFLLAMYELRHYFKGQMEVYGTSALPAALGLWLAALPLVDRRPGGPVRRAIALTPYLALLLVWIGLSRASIKKDEADEKVQKALATAVAWRDRTHRMAEGGVPPDGPLAMIQRDPEYRAEQIYERQCAACHVLGSFGDRKKYSAPILDGWSTEAWLMRVMHEPDHDELFGKTAYKGSMPSMDVAPKDADSFTPMPKEKMEAAAHFLWLEGVEKGEPKVVNEAKRAVGEKVVKDGCTTCHLYKADGDLGGNGYAPELKGYGSLAWVRAQIANPATAATYRDKALEEAMKGHMPRFDEELSPQDIALLARYVRAKARGLPFPEPPP